MLIFFSELEEQSEKDTLHIEFTYGGMSKSELLASFSEQTLFEGNIGNWDALYDVLGSMEWISSKAIKVIHRKYPIVSESVDNETYIKLVAATVKHWNDNPRFTYFDAFDMPHHLNRTFDALFPIECKGEINKLIGEMFHEVCRASDFKQCK